MYRYYVLGTLALTYAFSVMDRQVMSILLEDLRAEFLLDDTQLGLLSGLAFALFYSVLGIPLARLADRSSRINIIAVCVAIWSVMTALCGAAQNFAQLFLGRVGVGVGEAGSSPPSHSMIADYFAPKERSLALAVVMMGASFGSLFGLVLGGFVAESYGWRMAFVAAGVPGLLLAAVLKISIREPVRGGLDAPATTSPIARPQQMSFRDTLVALWRVRIYRWVTIAHIPATFAGYAIFAWLPTLYLRQFDMTLSEVGVLTGLLFLVAGIPGYLLGGFLGDRLGNRDPRWRVWLPAIAMGLAMPAYIGGLWAPTATTTTVLIGIGHFLYQTSHGPSLAAIQNALAPQMRAQAVAFLFFFVNMIGLGLGPVLVGYVSDLAAPQFGDRSLSVALSVAMLGLLGAVLGYLIATRTMHAAAHADNP
jgi:MFS family permease